MPVAASHDLTASSRSPSCRHCGWRTCAGAAVPAARAGGSLLTAAVLARPLPVPVIKRVTEPTRRQNASKCHQQGNDKRCPQDHSVYNDGVLFLHLPQTSRLPHAGTGVSGPYQRACSAGSSSLRRPHALHQTISRRWAAAALSGVIGGPRYRFIDAGYIAPCWAARNCVAGAVALGARAPAAASRGSPSVPRYGD